MRDMAAVILAAGKGKRMHSDFPKILHRVAGRPLIAYPVELAQRLRCDPVAAVIGHGRELVEAEIRGMPGGEKISIVVQEEQLGTGHAVATALKSLNSMSGALLILSGDVPLLDVESVAKLKRAYAKEGCKLALLTFRPADAGGYGRIIRDGDRVCAVREHRDCSAAEKKISEVNAGVYLIDLDFLHRSVKKLKSANSQGEFYLTDLVEIAAARGVAAAVEVSEEIVAGVNDRAELESVDRVLRARINLELMRSGVTIHKPETVSIDYGVKVGRDTEIGAGANLIGKTEVGRGCAIGVGAVIVDSSIGDGATVKAYSVIEGAKVGPGAEIGPMARLRQGADIRKGAKVGNFVEIKNTVLGEGSKANHLAYLGDGEIGKGVNIGAGTIFCNYDGFRKNVTVIEDEVFIGSDSQLVAPVKVGRGAYVASGSTVTKDVPADALAIARARQENKNGVASVLRRMLKERKAAAAKHKSETGSVKGDKGTGPAGTGSGGSKC